MEVRSTREDLSMGVPTAIRPAEFTARPERGRLGNVVVVLGVVVVAIAVASFVLPRAAHKPSADQPAAAGPVAPPAVPTVRHTVVYELHGAHGARNVTYAGEGTSLVQQAEVPTPWSATFTRVGPADRAEFYSVSAQNPGPGGLSCRILVDGVPIAEKSVTGAGLQFSCAA
jgi:hypothetical protein